MYGKNKILSEVLREISIDEKELLSITKKIIKKIKNYFKGEIFLGGSLAKGTIIKSEKYDIDLFFMFKKGEKNISEKLEKCLKKIKYFDINGEKFKFKFFKIHGSRDYFIFPFIYKNKKINLEMIPIIKINKPKEAENIMDFSPLHVKYIKNKLNKKLKEEVKILKAFVKAINCYGAESYIRGFSGYSLELLILYYKSFLNLVKKASKWKKIIFIDIEKYYSSKKEAIEKINPSKISNILLIDPVDKNRNVLAALDEEKFNIFINKCKKFLKNPSKKFFFIEKIDLDKLKKIAKNRKSDLIFIEIFSKAKFDIAGAKALKFFKRLKQKIEENYYLLKDNFNFNEESNSAKIYFLVKKRDKILVKGPPVKLKQNFLNFKKKHKKIFIKKGRAFSFKKPLTFKKIIEEILKDKENYKITNIKIDYFKYSS